jgi:diacylglycerol kinase family enzyme
MRDEIAFFINQESGSGEAPLVAEAAASALAGLTVRKNLPRSSTDLTRACSDLDPGKTRAAVVFGGDGTQSYALRGLIENGVPLYPFPTGTANDLAQDQGITGCRNQLERLLHSDSIEEVRVLEVNGIPFSTVSGIGIGAELCEEYNELRTHHRLFKKVSQRMNCEIYSALALKNILKNWGKGLQVRITQNGLREEMTLSALMICNQENLAGNLKVAPGQNKHSDTFTVLIHPGACGMKTLRGLGSMKFGKIDSSFITYKTESIRIESLNGAPLTVFGDGEILTRSPVLEFRAFPKKLKVFRA